MTLGPEVATPFTDEELHMQGNGGDHDGYGPIIMPVPESAGLPSKLKYYGKPPAMVFQYRDGAGQLLYCTLRYNDVNGKSKEVLPATWRVKQGASKPAWHLKGFAGDARPRPLYGLDRLAQQRDATVLVVEGEKKCALEWISLAEAFMWAGKAGAPVQCIAVTWSGGAGAVHCTDLAPLEGRDCIIVPDNNLPGEGAADALVPLLQKAKVKSLRRWKPLPQLPVGWDIADPVPPEIEPATIVRSILEAPELESREPRPHIPLHAYNRASFLDIARRKWMHANHFIRGQVSMTVAPGGYGKSSLELVNAAEMATGRGLMGPAPVGRSRVLYWNGEDPDDEIERRIAAICIRYDIDPTELHGWLFLGSKLSGGRLAGLNEKGTPTVNDELFDAICAFCREHHIDCIFFDPMIAFHSLAENDNNAMEFLIKDVFEPFATSLDAAVELCHHTRKPSAGYAGDLTVDDARGGGAAGNACRSVRVLNRMTAKEAELPKIIGEDRRLYLRVARDKSNMAPPAKACWMHLKDIELPNGDPNLDIPGDHVQAAVPWSYPQPFEGVSTEDMHWMRDTVRAGTYRKDARSPDWAGLPLLKRLKLNPADKADRKKASEIIRQWIANRVLKVDTRQDERRRPRDFIVAGDWATAADDPAGDSPLQSQH